MTQFHVCRSEVARAIRQTARHDEVPAELFKAGGETVLDRMRHYMRLATYLHCAPYRTLRHLANIAGTQMCGYSQQNCPPLPIAVEVCPLPLSFPSPLPFLPPLPSLSPTPKKRAQLRQLSSLSNE